MFLSNRQISDSWLTGGILAVVGGGLDAYTYLCRGRVLATAETGNIVFLGLRLVERDWAGALFYLVPILSFTFGILVSEAIRRHGSENFRLHWRQYAVLLECLALCLVAMLPQGELDMVANSLVAFVCALQLETFRKINGNAVATTMCTGNLRSGTELLYRYRQTKDRSLLKKGLEYYLIDGFFIVGVLCSGLLSSLLGQYTVLVFAGLLAGLFVLLFFNPSAK